MPDARRRRLPVQGTVCMVKFGVGFFTESWEMAGAGISHGVDAGEFRWYLVGTSRCWKVEAVEEWIVLGDRSDTSWLHPELADKLTALDATGTPLVPASRQGHLSTPA